MLANIYRRYENALNRHIYSEQTSGQMEIDIEIAN